MNAMEVIVDELGHLGHSTAGEDAERVLRGVVLGMTLRADARWSDDEVWLRWLVAAVFPAEAAA